MRPRIDIQSLLRLTELADYVIPFAIRIVCSLGIADLLTSGPRTVAELAEQTGTHASSLQRVLRALACKGIFTEVEPGRFGLTPLAQPLRSDHPLSLSQAYPLMAADIEAWAHFDYSVRTGKAAFDFVHGMSLWDYLANNPEVSAQFDRGMGAFTALELRTLLPAYDWAHIDTLVDVGGGNGTLLAGILRRFPSMRGTLYDLPHVVSRAMDILGEAGVADRCEVVAGSFFNSVPPYASAYLLKRILYGWDDEHALEILTVVRASMRPDSRILVIEPSIENGSNIELAAILDLIMLSVDGGHIRPPDQLEALFVRAGLALEGVVNTAMFPIIVGRPASLGRSRHDQRTFSGGTDHI